MNSNMNYSDMKIVGLVLFFVIVLFVLTIEVVDCKESFASDSSSDFFERLEKKLLLQDKQIKSQSKQDDEIRKIMNDLTKLRSLAKRYNNLMN